MFSPSLIDISSSPSRKYNSHVCFGLGFLLPQLVFWVGVDMAKTCKVDSDHVDILTFTSNVCSGLCIIIVLSSIGFSFCILFIYLFLILRWIISLSVFGYHITKLWPDNGDKLLSVISTLYKIVRKCKWEINIGVVWIYMPWFFRYKGERAIHRKPDQVSLVDYHNFSRGN